MDDIDDEQRHPAAIRQRAGKAERIPTKESDQPATAHRPAST